MLAAVVTTALAVALIPRWGIEGAAVASAVGYAAGAAAAWLLFHRVARRAAA